MSTSDPGNGIRGSEPGHGESTATLPAPTAPWSRARIAASLFVLACLGAVAAAALPWLTVVTTEPTLRLIVTDTLYIWHSVCGVIFIAEVFPLVVFGWAAVNLFRGAAPRLTRRSALLLSLAGLVGTLFFEFQLIAGNVYTAILGIGWCRGCATNFTFDSGFVLSLAAYALACVASLLLPGRASG